MLLCFFAAFCCGEGSRTAPTVSSAFASLSAQQQREIEGLRAAVLSLKALKSAATPCCALEPSSRSGSLA
ncbi:MAG: hypothetical protein WKF84_12560 [Pyrinomonadaceae bacterium]